MMLYEAEQIHLPSGQSKYAKLGQYVKLSFNLSSFPNSPAPWSRSGQPVGDVDGWMVITRRPVHT